MQVKTGNTQNPLISYTSTTTTAQKNESTSSAKTTTASTATQTSFSSLASLLSDAATRAEKRDATSSRAQLQTMAEALLNVIDGPVYTQNKAKHDQEVPDTNSTELLQLATKATDFLNGKTTNPFAGMQREQLSLIAYDDGSSFTVNERRAALKEIGVQEDKWTQSFISSAQKEIGATGTYKKSYAELLNHYRELPAIEQAQYSADLEQNLVNKISSKTSSNSKDTVFTDALLTMQKQQISSMRMQISSLSLFSLAASR
ncbi:hypothetical protein [Phytobacter sp. V91]|uniref:hypothetical protein n=1 Tax=Phytobacter sp. V91 TaxID=3369425 RepID=UPI003F5F3058